MIRGKVENAFIVRSGSKKYLVEISRTNLGKTYIIVHEDLTAKYTKGDEVKEWAHNTDKLDEVEFKALPTHIRKAITLNLKKL